MSNQEISGNINEFLQQQMDSLSTAQHVVDKIVERSFCRYLIRDMIKEQDEFACNKILHTLSETVEKSNNLLNDYESEQNLEYEEIEPQKPGLDSYASFHLSVKKQTIITKLMPNDSQMSLNLKSLKKGPSSVYSRQSKIPQKQQAKHLKDTGDYIYPKPLITTAQTEEEEDRFIVNYRKKKEKEQNLKEEEKKKKEQQAKKLKEQEKQSKLEADRHKDNKEYTYDSNGDIIFIKNIKTDLLLNPVITPPIKVASQRSKRKESAFNQSQQSARESMQSQRQDKSKYIVQKKHKLTDNLEHSNFSNIVAPMGSVFDIIEPTQGAKIAEKGQTKYGVQSLSKKNEGQMSLEEYKYSSTFYNDNNTALLGSQTLQQASQSKMNNENNKQSLLTQPSQSFYQTSKENSKVFDFTNQRHFNSTQFQFQPSRVHDKILTSKRNSLVSLFNKEKENQYDSSQVSHVESLVGTRKDKSLPSLKLNLGQVKQGFHTTQNSLDRTQYQYQDSVQNFNQTQRSNMDNQMELLGNKNRELMNDFTWGHNPTSIEKAQKIQKKPITFINKNLRHTYSQQLFTNKRKSQQNVDVNRNKIHLPPPPIGRSLGHGLKLTNQ